MRPPQGVVFDMDGLLLDSERVALESFVAACRRHGFDPEPEQYHPCIGIDAESTQRVLRAAFGPDFPLAAVSADWARIHEERMARESVPLKPGARAALQAVSGAGVAMGLATSTARALALPRLAAARIDRFFEERSLVCGDELARGKPHPEPYLEAVRMLGLPAGSCWAVEDSDNGVRSASAAGLLVIQVPDLVAPAEEVRALGHTILPTLADFQRLFLRVMSR